MIHLSPIAFVSNTRREPTDDHWGEIISDITLADHIPSDTLLNIEDFSHLEIVYYFDKVKQEDIRYSGHPRGNKNYPVMGIYGQRKKDRPNQLGLCNVKLLKHVGRTLTVQYLDAIDGTPVLDIKPIIKEFLPKGEISQPDWVSDLMKEYW